MGRLASASLFSFESKKCGCALFAPEKTKNCCHDESELVKVESDHAVGGVLMADDLVAIELSNALVSEGVEEDSSSNRKSASYIGTRPPPPVPLYSLYSSFRFFDDVADVA
jgi:hypothetical protein